MEDIVNCREMYILAKTLKITIYVYGWPGDGVCIIVLNFSCSDNNTEAELLSIGRQVFIFLFVDGITVVTSGAVLWMK